MLWGKRAIACVAVSALAVCACSKSRGAQGASGNSAAPSNVGGAGGTSAVGSGAAGAGGTQSGGSAGSAGSAPASAGSGVSGGGGTSVTTPATGGVAGSGGGGATAGSGGSAGAAGSGSGGTGGSGMQPYKGVANSPCAARTSLDVSWYYNWGQTETEPCSDGRGGEFVPMIWGHTGAEQTSSAITTAITSFVSHGYGNVLGFNEPDNSSQSNIPVATAISLWPAFANPGLRIGSPGTAANANPGQAWFKDFMSKVTADPTLRVDFLAIHWYGWNAGSCDAKASGLESYIKWAEGFAGNRPIWLTEWGCLNQSAPDTATVVSFLKGAIAMLAKHPRVERYSWYPWATNCGLVNKDGTLTELGTVYAAAPAYK